MIKIILFLITINSVIVFFLKKISSIIDIFDSPNNELKIHITKTPLIGGIIIYLNIIVILIYQYFTSDQFLFLNNNFSTINNSYSLLSLLTGYFILGLIDDKINLNPYLRFFAVIIVTFIFLILNKEFIISSFYSSSFNRIILFKEFGIVFTIFCVLILMNSLNFYDGLNGQSILLYLILFLYLFSISKNIFYFLIILNLVFILYTNLAGRIFLGDNGVYLLSGILSFALIYEYKMTANIIAAEEIFLLLIFPGFDLIRLVFERMINKKNPLFGDLNHFHHLLRKKFNLFYTNLILLILNFYSLIIYIFYNVNFIFILFQFTCVFFLALFYLKKNN